MARCIKYILLITLVVIVITCVEPYTPSLEKYEDVLVIDGLVTNARGPYTVKLSRSFRYDDPFGSPESDAYILLMDNQGNTTGFTEESPGIYRSGNPDFQGVLGRSYKLYVNTLSNEEYESDYVELKVVPDIENLYAQLEEQPVNGSMETGFQIYVDSYDPQNNTRYYRYEYEETWEFYVPFPSLFYYQSGELIPRTESVAKCWMENRSTAIMTFTTNKLEEDVVEAFPVCFVSTTTNRLRAKYSILVKQYSLTAESYQFWEQMKSTNQNTGTLFDPQPTQINGNMYSLHDTEKPVLGFFEASAVSEKRIFISRGDLPSGIKVKDQFEYCQYYYTVVEPNMIEKYVNKGYCVIGMGASETILVGYGIIPLFDCCDCTQTGTDIEPVFWN